MISQEELRSIPTLHRIIERDKEQLLYLEEKAKAVPSIMPSPDKVQTSPSNNANKYSDAAIDLSKEIAAKEETLKKLKAKAEEFVRALPEGSHSASLTKKIIKYRYIECLIWADVADLTGYDIIYVQRLAKACIENNLLQ